MLGFVAGVIARVLMPGDVFRDKSGPASWALSIGLGLLGAMLGWVIFTLGLGIGDDDIFDSGGIISAVIGTMITIAIFNWYVRRDRSSPPSTPTPPV